MLSSRHFLPVKPQQAARIWQSKIFPYLDKSLSHQSDAAWCELPATARMAAEKPGPGNLQVKGQPVLNDRAIAIQMLP